MRHNDVCRRRSSSPHSVPDLPSLREEVRTAQLKCLNQDQGLTIGEFTGIGKPGEMIEGQLVYFDALILIGPATPRADAIAGFVCCQVEPQALGRDRRHAPDARYKLHLANGEARFLHGLFPRCYIRIKSIEATRYRFHERRRSSLEDGKPRLRDKDRTASAGVVGEHCGRIAMILQMPLLHRTVGKLNPAFAQAQPAIINQRLACDFHLHSGAMPAEGSQAKRITSVPPLSTRREILRAYSTITAKASIGLERPSTSPVCELTKLPQMIWSVTFALANPEPASTAFPTFAFLLRCSPALAFKENPDVHR